MIFNSLIFFTLALVLQYQYFDLILFFRRNRWYADLNLGPKDWPRYMPKPVFTGTGCWSLPSFPMHNSFFNHILLDDDLGP